MLVQIVHQIYKKWLSSQTGGIKNLNQEDSFLYILKGEMLLVD